MPIDTQRHEGIFDSRTCTNPIHIIGVGGIGSHVVRHLVLLGCGVVNELHVWDGDTVAPHNLANQIYVGRDVGQSKVSALGRHALSWGGVKLREHPQFFNVALRPRGVVFLCVDTMQARKDIWESAIKSNANVPLFVESRMDATNVLIHVIDPCNKTHVTEWERYWYPDSAANNQIAGCGGKLAVGPTASAAADLAVWQFIRWAAVQQGYLDVLDQQIRMKMRPLELQTYQWSDE